MSNYYLGETSKKRLSTCCPELQRIIETAISTSPLDFGVVCGYRGEMDQETAFAHGNSNAHWGESDHNVRKGDKPYSMAVDLAPYDSDMRDYVWQNDALYYQLGAHILSVASNAGYKIRWGGGFSNLDDPGHFSIIL